MKSKRLELDDIGFIGDGRSISEEETRLASEHIQAYKAKAASRKAGPKPAVVKVVDAKKSSKRRAAPVDGLESKKFDLDDIGRIGGERPYMDEDARVVSAHIQAKKAKGSAKEKIAKLAPVKRKTKARVKKA